MKKRPSTKNGIIERDLELKGHPVFYVHTRRCEGGCDYDCAGRAGFRLADRLNAWRKRRVARGGAR